MSRILLFSLAMFAACQLLHVLWWRIRRPATYATWVPALALIFFGVGGLLAWWAVASGAAGESGGRLAWPAIMLCHGSLSLVYLFGYTLVSASSPSLEILKRLEDAPDGLPRSEVALSRPDEELTGQRIRNLSDGSIIRLENGEWVLGPRGKLLARAVLLYRHVVGMPDGGGG